MRALLGVDLTDAPAAAVDVMRPWVQKAGCSATLAYADGVVQLEPYLHQPGTPHVLDAELDARIQGHRSALEKLLATFPPESRDGIEVFDGNAAGALATASPDYDLVVVGTHGRTGLAHLLMGSVAELVVRWSKSPVLVVKKPVPDKIRAMIAADVDDRGTALVEQALPWLQRLADRVDLLYCEAPPLVSGEETAFGVWEELLERQRLVHESALRLMANRIPDTLRGEVDTVLGSPAKRILERAESRDLLVLGTHGRTGMDRLWFGSVAEQVVRRSPCSVLLIHV